MRSLRSPDENYLEMVPAGTVDFADTLGMPLPDWLPDSATVEAIGYVLASDMF
jgi:hypothetical protein